MAERHIKLDVQRCGFSKWLFLILHIFSLLSISLPINRTTGRPSADLIKRKVLLNAFFFFFFVHTLRDSLQGDIYTAAHFHS